MTHRKRKVIGASLIIAPPILLIGSLSLMAIASFIGAQGMASSGELAGSMAAYQVLRTMLSIVGLLGLIGLFIGIPIGIYLLATSVSDTSTAESEIVSHVQTSPSAHGEKLRRRAKILNVTLLYLLLVGAVSTFVRISDLVHSIDCVARAATVCMPSILLHMVETIVSVPLVVAFPVLFIGYFFWVYAVEKRLHELGVPGLKFTPGWAVGWHFIPVVNGIASWFVAYEIYTKSYAARGHKASSLPFFIGLVVANLGALLSSLDGESWSSSLSGVQPWQIGVRIVSTFALWVVLVFWRRYVNRSSEMLLGR